MTTADELTKAQADYQLLVAQSAVALKRVQDLTDLLAKEKAMPRITVALLNGANLSEDTMAIYVRVLVKEIAKLKEHWELPIVDVVTVPTKGAWEVNITTENRRLYADGWHFYGPTGLPYAYVLPGTGAYPFGTYRASRLSRLVGKVWSRFVPEYFRSGCLTVIVHETLEMLIDPLVKTVS